MSAAGFDSHNHQLLCSRFIMSGQWDRAWETAREWLAQDPENTRAHLWAGQALLNLERHSEAEKHLQCVLAAEPNNDTAHRFLAVLLFAEKRYREADESIHRAIAIDPEDAQHWYCLASMFYEQGDLAAARKYGAKARELNPGDPAIMNLLALSAPPPLEEFKANPNYFHQRLEQYHQALELDPENAEVHNNIGVAYLNDARDYQKAEECFRQALFLNPRLAVARNNLFLTLKNRDPVYRWLCAPLDWVVVAYNFIKRRWRKHLLLTLLLVPVWLLCCRQIFAAITLWILLVWPMVRVYEALTVGDIRARAGEIGARRGGFLGYRRWSLRTRLALFAGMWLVFWTSVGVAVYHLPLPPVKSATDGQVRFLVFISFGLVIVLSIRLKQIIQKRRVEYHARRRGRRFDGILGDETAKRPWWQPWRRH